MIPISSQTRQHTHITKHSSFSTFLHRWTALGWSIGSTSSSGILYIEVSLFAFPLLPCLFGFSCSKIFAYSGLPFHFVVVYLFTSFLGSHIQPRSVLLSLFLKFVLAGSSVLYKYIPQLDPQYLSYIIFFSIYLHTYMHAYGPTICLPLSRIVHTHAALVDSPPGFRGTVSITYASTLCQLLFAVATAHVNVHCVSSGLVR